MLQKVRLFSLVSWYLILTLLSHLTGGCGALQLLQTLVSRDSCCIFHPVVIPVFVQLLLDLTLVRLWILSLVSLARARQVRH